MNGINTAGGGLIAAQEASLRSEISYAVAAKQRDARNMQGEAALQLIEAAGKMSRQIGKGHQFDSLA
ncbi:MAG: hypothetical protein ACQESR_00200 [Planctomycetota bacterium]